MRWEKTGRGLIRALVFVLFSLLLMKARATQAAETKVPVTFAGGHETDRRDGGRPVVLIAAALGVEPEVFREAFRGVTPRQGPAPDRR